MNVTSSGANKDAVGAKTKDTLAHLMLRNLSEVFGERDSERRMAAIKNLYSEDAVFFEAEQRFEGRQTISDAVAALRTLLLPPREAQEGPQRGRRGAGGGYWYAKIAL